MSYDPFADGPDGHPAYERWRDEQDERDDWLGSQEPPLSPAEIARDEWIEKLDGEYESGAFDEPGSVDA